MTRSQFPLGEKWAKWWLQAHDDLHKIKRKPLAAERKNTKDPELLSAYFRRFKTAYDELGVTPLELWNLDETGFRVGVGRHSTVTSRGTTQHIGRSFGQAMTVGKRRGTYLATSGQLRSGTVDYFHLRIYNLTPFPVDDEDQSLWIMNMKEMVLD